MLGISFTQCLLKLISTESVFSSCKAVVTKLVFVPFHIRDVMT